MRELTFRLDFALAMTAPVAAAKAPALDVRALYDAHAPFVGRVLQRLTGPGPHVDELLQEVFVTAWKRASSFEGRSTERTWLYGIAANIARHHRRGLARFSFFRGKLERETAIAAPPPAPDEELTRSQDAAAVHAVLAELPFKQREAFVLYEIEGMPGEEIAAMLDVPIGTIWRRLHDARETFKTLMKRRKQP